MIHIPVYLRLWRLYASNKHLLKLYYFLYYDVAGEEASFYRREFGQRIHRREKINEEIERYLKEHLNMDERSKLSKAIGYFFPTLFSLDYLFQNMIFPMDLDRCQSFEIKNLEMYYEFLYSGTGQEEITEMLLNQKSEIEDSVYIEI